MSDYLASNPQPCACKEALYTYTVPTLRNRTMTSFNTDSANKLSIVSTLVDAALAFRRGRSKSGLLLLVAAALSSRIPGVGAAASLLLRIVRRLR